jgi:signal transduction histidine kinase
MSTDLNEIRESSGGREDDLGPGLLQALDELTPALGFAPVTRVRGAVDALPPDVSADLRAVLREALTNVARHAHARSAEVEVAVAGEQVTLRVTDDGIGCAGAPKDGGLADARRRATWHGGDLTVAPGPAGGTRLTWTVPLR